MHENIPSMTLGEMKVALQREKWIWENILGGDFETQDFIFDSQGGYDKFWEINLWKFLYPQHFK